jgi:hypothetical protein
LREKLAKIEGTTLPKPRTKERGPTSVIRTKVRSWNQGVLRRRHIQAGLGPSRSITPSIEVIEEEKPEDPNSPIEGRRSSDTNRVPSDASQTSVERSGAPESSDNITSDETNTNETSSTGFSRSATQPPTATYFPPAYRPASVRSLQVQPSGSSSRPPPTAPPTAPVVEKTTAPGYYPAPATEDSEVALAVASRSDGKQRMDAPPPDEEEEQRVRHIATDDKHVLERMRLGGSAPPRHEADEDGPSAPIVQVDEQGFELHNHDEEHDTRELAPVVGESSSSLPAPPQRPIHRVYSEADLAETMKGDESHLLPSAPPAHEDHLVPSAPPPAHEDHLVPSAPPFIPEEEEATPTAPSFDEEEEEVEVQQRPEHSHHSPVLEVTQEELEDHSRKPSLPTYVP